MEYKTEKEEVVAKESALVNTLEGAMRAEVGDYIIKGVKGGNAPLQARHI